MANTKQTKKYLGGWDTDAYDKLSEASRNAYETNWQSLKDRFNAIMEESERQQQLAENEYANTLAQQNNVSLKTQRAIDQDLSNRGIINSGIRTGLVEDSTKRTGMNVDNAISELMNTTTASGNAKMNALNNLISEGNSLNADQLNDQLNILANKQAEDMAGQQLAANLAEQEAARAAANARSGDADEEYNEYIRRMAVLDILNGVDPETGEPIDMEDSVKAYLLENVYDVKDADSVINLFNKRQNAYTDESAKIMKDYEKSVDEASKLGNKYYDTMNDINKSQANNLTRYITGGQINLEGAPNIKPAIINNNPINELQNKVENILNSALNIYKGNYISNKYSKALKKSSELGDKYVEVIPYYNMTPEDYYRTIYAKR